MPAAKIGAELAKLVVWIIKNFGADIAIFVGKQLKSVYSRLFADTNILILGAKGTGKTALLWLLSTGKPYKVVKGRIVEPEPTAGVVIVGKKFELQKSSWLSIRNEVGGEPLYREYWRQLIADIDPDGIIYLIDGRLDDSALHAAAAEAATEVLHHYVAKRRSLKALHIFLNFHDSWVAKPEVEELKRQTVLEPIRKFLQDQPALLNLRIQVSCTQLSPSRDSWPETVRALHHFGADLL